MPTFNSAPFVSRGIDSVLSQEGSNLVELIVVDDCSSDGTLDFIRRSYGDDARVKLYSTARNGGPGLARNLAIGLAIGDWIAPIDADDAWNSRRLSTLLNASSAEEADLIFDNLTCYDQSIGSETGVMFPMIPDSISLAQMAAEEAPASKFNYGYLKPLIRRAFLERSGILYPDARISEDLLFYLELIAAGARSRTNADPHYIYTTPIGQRSGRRSAFSASVPDDHLVASMLHNLVSRYRNTLSSVETDAIARRAARLHQSANLTMLYESWTRGRYLSFLWQCLSDAAARRALLSKLRNKCGWGSLRI